MMECLIRSKVVLESELLMRCRRRDAAGIISCGSISGTGKIWSDMRVITMRVGNSTSGYV